MSDQNSINTVRKTFESSFDKVRFVPFIKNLLNEYEDAPVMRTGNLIPDAYSDYVSKYERIGKYKDGDEKRIDILIVYLKKETSIERARSMQRNFIAGYLKGNYGTDSYKDAALVAFVAPNGEDWRFSLVKLEVKLDADDEGKIKLVDEFTPAKRWSFLVGSHEKSHTAQRQFQPILEDIENNPTLEDLEGAFNIEKVTDEFFKEYRRLFINVKSALDKAEKANPKTKADFESKGIDTVNLAKKLMGQIIFLYYLQKKGWFGVPKDGKWGEGSKNFLRELFEKKHGDYEDFFNDVLEPLFYDALRIDRSDEDYYYKRFKCKIPFLNGGLFDPMGNYNWEKTVINLSNSLFSNKTKGNPEGDGILDVFDLYNFTVNEDEPFEKEVAIDPELLGKAYEKFNAIRPDNYDEFLKALKSGKGGESKFNKQYGVYYTPREIVHHMCQQSLINYLATELEGKVSRDDIAMLILQGESLLEHEARAESKPSKTYQPILSEAIHNYAALIDEKLANIKVCDPAVGSGAFLVGMMSEIVRAREVLKTWTKTKLTTYDFKRQCIEHSLYGVDIDAGAVEIAKLRLWLSLIVDEDDVQNIKPLPNLDYKIVCGNSLVGFPENWGSPIEKEIEALIHQHFNETNPNKKTEFKTRIDERIESRYKNSVRAFGYQVNFDFRTVFSAVFQLDNGFDVLIGNPPYHSVKLMEQSEKKFFNATYKVADKRFNLFSLFIEKSYRLLKQNGAFAFIIPSAFLANSQYVSLRKFLLGNFLIKEIIDFKGGVFEDANVETLILLMQKNNEIKKENNIKVVFDVVNFEEHIFSERLQKQSEYLENNDFTFNIGQAIKDNNDGTSLLGELVDIRNGINTGNIAERIVVKEKINNNCKPLIDGKDVQRYQPPIWREQYILYDEKIVDKLRRDWAKKGLDWTARIIKKENYFEKEKLIVQRIRNLSLERRLVFTYDDQKFYTSINIGVVLAKKDSPYNLKYFLGLLNSNYLNNYFKQYFHSIQIKNQFLEKLPIPAINFSDRTEKALHDRMVFLVEKMLLLNKKTHASRSPQNQKSLEQEIQEVDLEIDNLVYKLYGLSKEQIERVTHLG